MSFVFTWHVYIFVLYGLIFSPYTLLQTSSFAIITKIWGSIDYMDLLMYYYYYYHHYCYFSFYYYCASRLKGNIPALLIFILIKNKFLINYSFIFTTLLLHQLSWLKASLLPIKPITGCWHVLPQGCQIVWNQASGHLSCELMAPHLSGESL